MKKFLIGFIAVIVVGAGVWFYFFKHQFKHSEVWEAVPNDAVVVIELSKADEWWNDHESFVTLKRLIQSELVDELSRVIAESDSILRAKGYSVFDLTGDKTLLITLTKSTMGISPTVIIPEAETDETFLAVLEEGFKIKYKETAVAYEQHEGVSYAIVDRNGKKLYATKCSGLYLLSPSEESFKSVINRIVSDDDKRPVLAKKKMHEATEVSTESLTIYINPVMLFQSIKPYMKDSGKSFIGALEHFADNAFLDVKFDDEAIYLNGFTHDSDTAFTFANCLKSQPPIPFTINSILPMRTISFAFLGIGDGTLFKQNLEEYSWSSSKKLKEDWDVLKKTYQVDVDEVYKSIKGEVVLLEVLNRLKTIDKLVYIKPSDMEQGAELFENISKNILEQDQELQREEYKDVEITYMGELDFPGMVFGEYFSGFAATYYASIGDYIVIAETEQPIKSLINDLEDDDVWSRSLEKNYLVERYIADANFGYYVDLNQSIAWLESNLSESGNEALKKYKPLLKQIGMLSLQISNENEQLFTSVTGVFEGTIPQAKQEKKAVAVQEEPTPGIGSGKIVFELFLDAPIIDKPTVVLNHVDKTRETLVLDANFKLHLVSSVGELLWSYQLDGAIVSDIQQVDIYKNQKLQYLFATRSKVYCIDRKGKDVSHYPYEVKHGTGDINTLSVIDYDGSKDYRVMISKTDGTVVMHDINGNDLEGWNPKKFETMLVQPGKHMRVKGKDCILLAEQTKLHLFTRRGDYYDGFPLTVSGNIGSDWFVNIGPSLRKSTVSILLDSAEMQLINFNAKIENTLSFKSLSNNPRAALSKSSGEEKKVFLLHPFGKVWQVLDENKKELLAVELPYNDLQLQYYPIAGKEVFVLVSEEADRVMIYDKKGKLIGGEALDGSHKIAMLYLSATNKYRVYIVNRKSLRMMDISVE